MIKLPETDTFFRKQKNILNWGAADFAILLPKLNQFRVCLDIGAHCGITTLRFAQHFKVVHSFEPLLHEFLVANTKHLPNINTYNIAVSNKNEIVDIYPNPTNSGGGIIPAEYNTDIIEERYTGPNPKLPGVEKVSVPCTPIDTFNFTEVDLIKIDVEGYIVPVIEGMIETLTNNAPVIQIEMLAAFDDINIQAHVMLSKLNYIKFGQRNNDCFYHKE